MVWRLRAARLILLGQVGRQVEVEGRASEGLSRGPRPVGRQIERGGEVREASEPVVELAQKRARLHARLLPVAVVGVLDGEVGQVDDLAVGLAGGQAVVGVAQLADEHSHRPPVAHHVMKC